MIKGQILTAIAKQLIPSDPEPCPVEPSCSYSGPGWCTAPAEERDTRQQKVLAEIQEEHIIGYIDPKASPWPCACILPGLGMPIEEALKLLEER